MYSRQLSGVPVHPLSSMQPPAETQSTGARLEQGVASPPQYGMPEPGPPRSHQPALLQRVFGKQSSSESHAKTQTFTPMQNELAPNSASHSLLASHGIVHCLWAM